MCHNKMLWGGSGKILNVGGGVSKKDLGHFQYQSAHSGLSKRAGDGVTTVTRGLCRLHVGNDKGSQELKARI